MTGATLIARLATWAAGLFFEIERLGDPIPGGPLLVVANHPNSLIDPLVIFRTVGRPTRPLAKAPLFEQPIIGMVLRGLGGLPVYRRQDDPALMDRNEDTLVRAVEALYAGHAVQIYPEGTSHSQPSLVPLRTGAARIALRAEDQAGWRLGLKVVPVGLTYTRKAFFRGRLVAAVGEPFEVTSYQEAYGADPAAAVRSLTDEIARGLEALTLNFAEREDADLIDIAERLYAREKGWVDWRERERLGERFLRLREFARALAWLRANDPARHQRLARRVRRYRQELELLGAGEAEVPPRYPLRGVIRYLVTEGALLGLGLPLAAAGVLFWYVPFLLPRHTPRWFDIPYESIATYKLAAAMITFPLAYALWLSLAWWAGGVRLVVAAAVVLPMLGLATSAYRDRWRRVKEDIVLFLRVALRPGHRERLAQHRAALVREFDVVARDMGASAREGPGAEARRGDAGP